MATLNGVEFQILTIEWATYQNNVVQEVIGGDTVVVHSQGYKTDPVKIQGRVRNEKELDAFQEEFYSGEALTFIKDISSGRQYQIYALGTVKQEDSSNDKSQTGIVFNCLVQLAYPYMESSEIITRSKTITTQNQEWSSDNDSNNIKTDGNVDAVPDISICNNQTGTLVDQSNSIGGFSYGLHSISDMGQTITTGSAINNIHKIKIQVLTVTTPGDIICTVWDSNARNTSYGTDTVNVSATGNVEFEVNARVIASTQYYIEWTTTANFSINWENNGNPYVGGDFYANRVLQANDDMVFYTYYFASITDSVIYNVADITVKCAVANTILVNSTHRINSDSTGTVDFDEDFTTGAYINSYTGQSGVTHDKTDDELDIADNGYIYWKKDTKFPIDGIPTLTSRINITSGTPTIQISTDASTWYDIDTAIVDDVETIYPLDSDGNLSLAGETVFYFRIDCVKAAAATCSIKYFELDINIHTIYAKNPKITKGSSASTFRCDQDSSSGMACIIDLIYRDKWWV